MVTQGMEGGELNWGRVHGESKVLLIFDFLNWVVDTLVFVLLLFFILCIYAMNILLCLKDVT